MCSFCGKAKAEVRKLMAQIYPAFFEFYELQHRLMRDAGQPVTTAWLHLVGVGRYYVPSNDFSCMVSNPMFRDFFLAELTDECNFLDRAVYHLDGPDALRHLDTLLAIESLQAIQYVIGAGRGPNNKWLHVFKKIQAAGRNLHISCGAGEVDELMANLRPEGCMLAVWVKSAEEADALVAKAAKWPRK